MYYILYKNNDNDEIIVEQFENRMLFVKKIKEIFLERKILKYAFKGEKLDISFKDIIKVNIGDIKLQLGE